MFVRSIGDRGRVFGFVEMSVLVEIEVWAWVLALMIMKWRTREKAKPSMSEWSRMCFLTRAANSVSVLDVCSESLMSGRPLDDVPTGKENAARGGTGGFRFCI